MRLVAWVAILSCTALREESGRFDLEVQENDQISYKGEANYGSSELDPRQPVARPFSPTEAFIEGAVDPAALESIASRKVSNESCRNGILHLQGVMVVEEELVFSEDCTVRGEPGSQVILRAPVIFRGDVQIHGNLQFTAAHGLQRACLTVEKSANVTGKIRFQNCHNENKKDLMIGRGGGLAVGMLSQQGGTIEFRNCSSIMAGGGMYIVKQLSQHGGTIEFHNCSSISGGGGLYVYKHLSQHNGTIKFQNCSSRWDGGGMRVYKHLSQHGGTIEFHNCSSIRGGGGLYISEHLSQHGGNIEFHHCSSMAGGGGLFVVKQLSRHGGTIEFHNCSSTWDGGGMYIVEQLSQHGGTIEFHNCGSIKGGGGMYIEKQVSQRGGTIEFHNCSSKEYGGGLYISEHLSQHGGNIEFHHCSSSTYGGGLFVWEQLSQHGGTIEFHSCTSSKDGGGLYISEQVSQHGGTIEFHNCSSTYGGGMHVEHHYEFYDGTIVFNRCTAEDGGGLWVGDFHQSEANTSNSVISFNDCSATRGGGIFGDTINSTQTLHFHHCRASESGGGLQISGKGSSILGKVRFENCSADRATAIEARDLTVQHLELVDTFDMAVLAQSLKVSVATFQVTAADATPTLSMEAESIEIDSEMDCTKLRECQLWFPASSQPSTAFRCGLGTGVATTPPFGCVACAETFTQVERVTSGGCSPCPLGAALCLAGKIQMKPGFMLHENNLSRPLHCPTQVACPGGELPVSNESQAMCREGYGDEGCAKCIKDDDSLYLMADSNVLACTPCAGSTLKQLLQWFSFLGQRVILFAVSAASIFGAGRADRVKNSGVYLNQLMAFAAVSGSVVTAVMQTETAQMMKEGAVEYLYGTAVFLSDASSGQGAKSSHCLLSYLSLEQSGVFGVHCLDVAVATFLVLVLSLKDWRVALVAGLNCFLPSIMADFAKYAVCYRLEENQSAGIDGLICNHLPFGNVFGFVIVGTAFLAVFALALFAWLRLSNCEDCKEDELPNHTAFLTNKYGEGRHYFEAERLVRKVLLSTAAAFFPSTTFPALQMTALLVIICSSMFLYAVFHPYRQQLWNWSESALLATALLLIAVASAVIANEDRWDKTELGQRSMIVTLGVIVTSVCLAFLIKIAQEVWRERQPQA